MLDFWLWLYSKPGVGTSRLRGLIQKYGINVSQKVRLKIQRNILGAVVREIVWKREVSEIQQYLLKLKITVVPFWCKTYPNRLKTIPDFPVFIFVRGNGVDWDIPIVSIIGTRRITNYGQNVVKDLLDPILNYKINVVTGLAWGVDSMVHRYMLNSDCSAKPVAVLAGGPLAGYPSANNNLYKQILLKGLVISEYLPGTAIKKGMFVSRNRLAAAISDLVVVVEASKNSGSLITAQFAVDYNRDVAAVPGSIFSSQSRGNLELIKQGAIPILEGSDIISLLNLGNSGLKHNFVERKSRLLEIISEVSGLDKNKVSKLVEKLLEGQIVRIEEFSKSLNKKTREARVCLTMLEVRGILRLERSGVIKLNRDYW